MFLIKLGRTFKAGFSNFYRNGWLSVATISVIVITLFIVNLQTAVVVSNEILLKDVQDRVSVSIYFKTDAMEADILKVKDKFSQYSEIRAIEYVSAQEAMDDFQKKNENNEVLRESLSELGINPFEASLNVKAHNSDDYELIAKWAQESEFAGIISSVNYHKYKDVIDGLANEVKSNRKTGFVLGLTLSVVAILITFNSIKITMHSYRQEIEIMRLVGASNNYIRLPFLWEGILYGLISAMLVLPLSYFYVRFLAQSGSAGSALPFSNSIYFQRFLTDYFYLNLVKIIAFQFIFAVLLGVLSSMIAIGKYLKK